ncbi:serine/threonine-protein kinase [Actinocorallia sp. A-T 12471]|uniref:serine/threonine-protein kinase n=1 Tax=Actinocorallia sp. A-T 12471 TaxID=3089813 RepID=UPI0029CD763A|nr:serine/threonine-protein kinase [Actinocorallia sp. A-T 12471]MDX6740863.1 serine/threonine-protein kinase [Actinocorallia sp. A-T 12471]
MTSGQNVIDGRFELTGRLGSGGMGTVWRAMDLALQREVALKEVRPGGGEEIPQEPALAAMYRERVLREARALARIDHPNVVTIHHVVDAPGMPFPWLVMELVRGESLQDRLSRGTLAPAEAARVGRGILAALRAAHAAGICHRDIKPANVLLREDGSPVLTDFGIAVLDEASRVTATGGLVGSPEYIAPERLHGHEGDPSSDLWSLGMLLYVAVEGQNPVRRATLAATLAAVMTAQIPRPERAGPLTDVIAALLVPDPAARPSAEQLDGLLSGVENGTAKGPGPGPATPPPYVAHQPGVPAGQPTAPPGFVPPPPPGYQPAYPQTPPPGYGYVPQTVASSGRARRRPLNAAVLIVGVSAAVAGILFAASSLLPFSSDANEATGSGPASSRPGIATGAEAQEGSGKDDDAAEKVELDSLLTPKGVRHVIKEFQRATGATEFGEFTVYEKYAFVEVPISGRTATDRYMYRDGNITKSSAGMRADKLVNPEKFRWDALPGLLKRADKVLNVPDPTMRYLIVKPAWTFNDDKPTLMVYVADDHGGGYLATDTQGKIFTEVPAD